MGKRCFVALSWSHSGGAEWLGLLTQMDVDGRIRATYCAHPAEDCQQKRDKGHYVEPLGLLSKGLRNIGEGGTHRNIISNRG